MTYLEIINVVLRRLREDEVTTYDQTAYSKLVGDFVNQTKREVEDAWDWTTLRSITTVTTISGTSQYTLTGVGDRFTVKDVWDNTEDSMLRAMNSQRVRRHLQTDGDTANTLHYYAFDGFDASRDPYVQFWPKPNGVYSVDFNCKVGQADLAAGATEVSVPPWPVALGALAKAISERGEDGGAPYSEIDQEFRKALSDAIAQDASLVNDELIMDVV